MKKELNFAQGVRDGVPIGLGYLSVSFSFGLMAVRAGLPVWTAVLISASNLTSAGQVAGLSIIAAGGALIEMIVTQFVINMRYALMAVSLSQKADASFTTLRRMTAAFGITDEIFAGRHVRREISLRADRHAVPRLDGRHVPRRGGGQHPAGGD